MAPNTDAIKIMRWVARILALVYIPFLLYGGIYLVYAVLLYHREMRSVVYLVELLSLISLVTGYTMLLWREVTGSWVVVCSELLLLISRSVFLFGGSKTNMQNFLLIIAFALVAKAIQAIVALLPATILYFCRLAEKRQA